MFTDAQKVDIRRFCGYDAFGGIPSGFSSWRFFQVYGLLEFRLSNLSAEEEAVVINTYLTNLYPLETGIVSSAANLDTDEAAVWKHNKNEVRDRTALFDSWRRRLCGFLGLPPGPFLRQGGTIRMVV